MATWTTSEHLSACLGQTDVFFPDNLNNQTLAKARNICRDCPLYERCVERYLHDFDNHPHGILFGYGESDRMAMAGGLMEYRDWRRDKRVVSKKTLAALERHARARGEIAVLDLDLIYETDDQEERERIVAAYKDWLHELCVDADDAIVRGQAELAYRRKVRYRKKQQEAKRPLILQALAEGKSGAPIPHDLRPECPNGHGKNVWKTKKKERDRYGCSTGRDVIIWRCFQCGTHVEADPAALAAAALRSA